jgi:serine protease AprX
MKKLYGFFLLIFVLCIKSEAQYTRHIVQLTDKKGTAHILSNPATFLSGRAIQRRIKQKITIDSTDLPVSSAYLDSIRNVANVTVLNVSKWLNQVLIRTTDSNALTTINSFVFVKSSLPIAPKPRFNDEIPINRKYTETINPIPDRSLVSGINRNAKVNDTINYGNSYNQVHIHEGEYLHNLGFTGEGIIIAILDAGFFGYKTNPAFDSVRLQNRVLGEYDYVLNEQSVNEDNAHGMYCFSIIAANRPGQIVGTAPHSSFWLFRTEDVFSEYPVEEQNWAAAAEFSDSAGADMISSSLGYADFDDPSFNYEYPERNGNTSIITRAADFAAKKGMIVMNSAGNSGNLVTDYKFVGCPADGDSVVAVGATDVNGNIASFSSWVLILPEKLNPILCRWDKVRCWQIQQEMQWQEMVLHFLILMPQDLLHAYGKLSLNSQIWRSSMLFKRVVTNTIIQMTDLVMVYRISARPMKSW